MNNLRTWKLSLLIVAVITIIWSACSILGIKLPDMAIHIMEITDCISIPVLVYTSMKIKKK